jgi:hypothetical protein
LALGLVLLPGAALAQSAGNFSEAAQSLDRYTLATTHPRLECRALHSRSSGEVTITATEEVAASENAPAFCRVTGVIAPEVQFEVDLPTNWNRRFYMFGNGGYAGESLEAPPRRALSAAAMRSGFLTAQTNTGHDAQREPLGTFASSLQKTIDYAFRAVHGTVVTAKRLANAYYGREVAFSYWDSCSTGGREGLMSAQRFPDDFDGILAGAPVRNFVDTMINYVWNAKALDGAGLTLPKIKAVAEATYARCDAQDGLKDGLIQDPRMCDFDPGRDVKQCAAGQDGDACLTPAQAQALDKIYSGITLEDGSKMFFGWPKGTEVLGTSFDGSGRQVSGWEFWIIDPEGKPSRHTQYMTTFMQNLAFGHAEPDFDWRKFDFKKDPPRMTPIRQLLNADETDLSAFRRHGGKLIMYHGWADTALTPFMSIDYYERAVAANGPDTPDFFRLFMIPGMAHCRGGVATDRFDGISSIVNWVENGAAPDSIKASRQEKGSVTRTRPLCPYPQVSTYSGSGSIDEAANFSCKATK